MWRASVVASVAVVVVVDVVVVVVVGVGVGEVVVGIKEGWDRRKERHQPKERADVTGWRESVAHVKSIDVR